MNKEMARPFRCPGCGEKLEFIPKQKIEFDWGELEGDDLIKAIDIDHKQNSDGSLDYKCPKGCYGGIMLTAHHPIYGIKHAPGDSWSLSLIE